MVGGRGVGEDGKNDGIGLLEVDFLKMLMRLTSLDIRQHR